ncbi:hypothetical protein BUY42_00335 [Staphylococcus devriesei]|uniref:hypothetical protein n=1 Tax=Staphylococcus TaxID=1279 RepID=UPI000D1D09C4|nr:hypothetical protein [Staphylococcus devriesei]PTE69897.1 hypothetical protein BUY46_01835 [Staphylococcus devriesei]PTF20462.1 hypothetical protein BUY42_00335 [Staphylococcus devriesei]RIL69880.1 hypothetical protein BUY49_10755 [Staphylococcus devriesei]
MKQHKFKRMAYDLMELIPTNRFQVDYKYSIIWFAHFDERYTNGVKTLCMDNVVDDESSMLTKFELAKKVIKGEAYLNE